MAFRRAGGLRFHVQQLGKRAAGAPVVMLHGLFTGSLASWSMDWNVRKHLARRPTHVRW